MSAIIIQCTIADLEAEPNFVALVNEYADECAIEGLPRPHGKLDLYKAIEKVGMMFAFAAKLDGVLIGFMVVIATTNPHYGIILATTETLFVKKEHRDTGAGGRLIAEAKQLARDVKSPGLFIVAPMGSQLANVLEARKDCRQTNRVFFMGVS